MPPRRTIPDQVCRQPGKRRTAWPPALPGLAHYHLANFRVQALLLAGRIDDALTLLPTAHALTNGSSDTTMTVLPYVLAISCGAVAHRDWEHTVLRTLLHGAARTERVIFYDDDLHADDADTAFVQLLEGALREQTSTASERAGWRRAARTAIDRSVHTIVGGKQRARYNDAASLAAALAEAEIIIDGESTYLDAALDTYRRHIAFRREADDVRRASVLL